MSKPDLSKLDYLLDNDNNAIPIDPASLETEDSLDNELENTVLRLSDYLAAVEMVMKETFRHSVWVKAEIRNLSSKGGHYYFELAEKDDTGKVIASCRGNLWRFKATRVLRKFEQTTGMALERDVTVLLNVNASFHPLYGASLTINDIDPSYTLGDLARQYAAMLEQLGSEGLLTLNKQVAAPFDIEHVLVIAPEKAAGLGDFRADADRLHKTSACHFHYHHATFQGNHAPVEIRHAITKGMVSFKHTYKRLPDVMVIIRGGGAVGDLAYLNDYELAALVAEQPIPVWVGIGHERDNVILDEVAHTSFDTPSKVISAISSHLAQLIQNTIQYVDYIKQESKRQLSDAKRSSERQFSVIENNSRHRLQRWQHSSDTYFNNIKQHAKFELRQASTECESNIEAIHKMSQAQIMNAQYSINTLFDATKNNSYQRVNEVAMQLRHYQQLIFIQHPARQLEQGYALVKNQQQTYISSIKRIDKGDFIEVAMQDGGFSAVVTDIRPADGDI